MASGIVTDYGDPPLDKKVNQEDAEGANIQGEPLDIDSAQIALRSERGDANLHSSHGKKIRMNTGLQKPQTA